MERPSAVVQRSTKTRSDPSGKGVARFSRRRGAQTVRRRSASGPRAVIARRREECPGRAEDAPTRFAPGRTEAWAKADIPNIGWRGDGRKCDVDMTARQ